MSTSIKLNTNNNANDKKANKIKCSINKEIRQDTARLPLIGGRFIARKCRYSVIFPLNAIHFPFFTKKRARDVLIERQPAPPCHSLNLHHKRTATKAQLQNTFTIRSRFASSNWGRIEKSVPAGDCQGLFY